MTAHDTDHDRERHDARRAEETGMSSDNEADPTAGESLRPRLLPVLDKGVGSGQITRDEALHVMDTLADAERPATPDAGDASTSASEPLSPAEWDAITEASFRGGAKEWRAEVERIIAARAAKARAEGHREGYETARGDFISGAFISGPTYEALRDSFTGQRIVTEARAEAGERIAQAIEAEARAAHEVADESGVHYDHAASIAREVTR